MDLGTSFELKDIIGSLIGAGGLYFVLRKKFSFDNLEITKSDTERELIELLREQVKLSSSDLSELRTKFDTLEERSKILGKERDEAIQEVALVQSDITRCESKIRSLEEIIERLTDALEVASARLNGEIEDQESE